MSTKAPDTPKEFGWMHPGTEGKVPGQYGQIGICVIHGFPFYNAHEGIWKVIVGERDNPGFMPQITPCANVQHYLSEELPDDYAWLTEGVRVKLPNGEITRVSVEPRKDAYGWLVGTESQPVYCGLLRPVERLKGDIA